MSKAVPEPETLAEIKDRFQKNGGKTTIKNADMATAEQIFLIDCAIKKENPKKAVDQFTLEKDIAALIKKEADKKYGPTWHCIVGRNFGSYVTHESKHFLYFYINTFAVLLFKAG
ncbi:unnamed protein product [Oikopleura dioica]|uniref:Dynein light chain n=1 Tax=Oikopleura dioica TaxID=34765 RepID=E4X9V0_OIKDI|nr:unnamed protein product [Oikopleura dioica]